MVLRKEITWKTYRDFKKILPRIKRKDVKLIFSSTHYDGPCSGMLWYQEQKYWFDIINSFEHWYRYFAIIKISEEEILKEETIHKLFQDKVGMHTTYNLETQTRLNRNKSYEEHIKGSKEYYEIVDKLEHKHNRYANNEVIGWFKY